MIPLDPTKPNAEINTMSQCVCGCWCEDELQASPNIPDTQMEILI